MPFNCPVCFSLLDKTIESAGGQGSNGREQSALLLTSCGHMVHRVCLTRWLARDSTLGKCPSCKKKTQLKNSVAVFPSFRDADEEDYLVDQEEPCKSQKKCNKGSKSQKSAPGRPVPQEVPELECKSKGCTEFHKVHSSLVKNYNEMVGKVEVQSEAVSKTHKICKGIQAEIDVLKEVSKSQDVQLRMLLKRPLEPPLEEESDDDEETEDSDEDSTGEDDNDEEEGEGYEEDDPNDPDYENDPEDEEDEDL